MEWQQMLFVISRRKGNNKRPSEFIVEYEIDGRYEGINILN